jgi:hypothetical protein
MADNKVATLIGIVILVVIAAVMFPLINTQVSDLTDNTSANYVGSSTAPIVSLVPIFYWLMVALVVIGAAIVTLKSET